MSLPFVIRMATAQDAAALCAIYAPYVQNTAISFEYEVPSVEEFAERIQKTLARYPYLVAEREGRVLGYAYAGAFSPRAAYHWSVEMSIYIEQDVRGGGVGRALYQVLETLLLQQGVYNLNACIVYPNPASIAFHERLGFSIVGHFHSCGFKLGQWWDMVWMEKRPRSHPIPPDELIAIGDLAFSPIPCNER